MSPGRALQLALRLVAGAVVIELPEVTCANSVYGNRIAAV
jgi:hypothetical protein